MSDEVIKLGTRIVIRAGVQLAGFVVDLGTGVDSGWMLMEVAVTREMMCAGVCTVDHLPGHTDEGSPDENDCGGFVG